MPDSVGDGAMTPSPTTDIAQLREALALFVRQPVVVNSGLSGSALALDARGLTWWPQGEALSPISDRGAMPDGDT